MTYIIQLVGAFITTIAAGIMLEAPPHLLVKAAGSGVVSYAFYLFLLDYAQMPVYAAVFLSCFLASNISLSFARIFKAPATTFILPVFFLFVPGSALYQTALYFINGEVSQFTFYLIQTISQAGSIALGYFIADSLWEMYFALKRKL